MAPHSLACLVTLPPLPFPAVAAAASLIVVQTKRHVDSRPRGDRLGYCTHTFPHMGECGPAGSPFVHSFGHTFLFQNSGMKLRPLPLHSTFGLSASTPSYGRQTSLPLSSRMTCTSLERLALLLSLSLSVALLGRTGAEPFVRCSTKVTHYIDTCHLPPSPSPSPSALLPSCLVMCAVKLVRQPLHYWRRRTDGRTGKCRMAK